MQEIELLKKVIKKAGEEAMKFYDNPEINYKADQSPVTEADLASEKVLLETLKKTNYPILSEESEDDFNRLKAKKVWIVDPLDGTQDFIQKTGEFSVMVGLVENGRPILGAVYQPADKKLFYAKKGEGAFVEVNDNRIEKLEISDVVNSSKAKMVVSRNHLKPEDENLAQKLKAKNLKKVGSNGVKIGIIAEGQADFFVNSGVGLGEWDMAAPEIILTEAGGKMTDVNGKQLVYNQKNPRMRDGLVASNGKFHDKIIKAI